MVLSSTAIAEPRIAAVSVSRLTRSDATAAQSMRAAPGVREALDFLASADSGSALIRFGPQLLRSPPTRGSR
jgi:hypothetical protein